MPALAKNLQCNTVTVKLKQEVLITNKSFVELKNPFVWNIEALRSRDLEMKEEDFLSFSYDPEISCIFVFVFLQ